MYSSDGSQLTLNTATSCFTQLRWHGLVRCPNGLTPFQRRHSVAESRKDNSSDVAREPPERRSAPLVYVSQVPSRSMLRR